MPYTDHTNPDTAAAFDAVAPTYDNHFSDSFSKAEESLIFDRFNHVFQLADVLDIGCGTGRVKRFINKITLFKPRSYVGVDISPGMIKVARSAHPSGTFIHCDMVEFMNAQDENSYDVVSAMYFPLNYCTTPLFDLYAAVSRVLRPGGHFLIMMATSRYPACPGGIVPICNMRRFFFNRRTDFDVLTCHFKVVAVEGYNYYAEKYRRWLNLCPKVVNTFMLRYDQSVGRENNKMPYFYAVHLQKEWLATSLWAF